MPEQPKTVVIVTGHGGAGLEVKVNGVEVKSGVPVEVKSR